MDDPFLSTLQQPTYNNYLQPSSADRRASTASTNSITTGEFAQHYIGTSPSSVVSYQEYSHLPGLSSGGSSNPSLSPNAPHSPFTGSTLSRGSLQAEELAQLLSTKQQLSLHVPSSNFDSLISSAGFVFPDDQQQLVNQSQNTGIDGYGDGNEQFLDMNGRFAPSSTNAFVSPTRSEFGWNGMNGIPGQLNLMNSNSSSQYSSYNGIRHDRRASVAQSEMSAISNFSEINTQRGFVGGLMTDNQMGWGIGSGMELSNGMGPGSGIIQQQEQQQQQQYTDSSFDASGMGDISDEQFAALVAGTTGDFTGMTSQYSAPHSRHASMSSQPQISINLSTDVTQPSQIPYIFRQQMAYPTTGNLMAPLSSSLKGDASKSSSDHSDAEMNGVSLAQIAGGDGKKVGGVKASASRRGSGIVDVKAEHSAGQDIVSTNKKSGGLSERSVNVQASSPATPAVPPAKSSRATPAPPRARGKRDADNLHNIVEQRYRKNVKGSLDMLRDSVPRLRHLYKTSTPHQAATTDRDLGDGLVGGVRDLGKPTKKTVMEGARLYIVYLEREVGAQIRRADFAEGFIRTNWPAGFADWENQARDLLNIKQAEADAYIDAEERRLRSKYGLTSSGDDEADEQDEEDEEEEEEQPRKKTKKSASDRKSSEGSVKPSRKGKRSVARDIVPKVGSVASSFAVAYTFFPKASKVFSSSSSGPMASNARGSVLFNAPYQAASKSSAFLARALPEQAAPDPDIVMEWFWLIALASVLTAITWIVLERFVIGTSAERDVAAIAVERKRHSEIEQAIKDGAAGGDRLKKLLGVGTVGAVVDQAISTGLARIGWSHATAPVEDLDSKAWESFANAAVGGVTNMTALARLQLSWFLSEQSGADARRLALRSLLMPTSKTANALWANARCGAVEMDDPVIRRVLALPLPEAAAILQQVQPTNDPLGAVANHLVLVHLNDILSRIYITLVDASLPKIGPDDDDVAVVQLGNAGVSSTLQRSTFTNEIQAVLTDTPRGSEGYALGLVLIAVWGLLAGQNVEMRRRVAYMLAVEDLQGVAGNLASVHAVLEMFVPGSTGSFGSRVDTTIKSMKASSAAKEVDALALACIRWLGMLKSVSRTNDQRPPAQWIKVASLELRVLLAEPVFRRKFRERGKAEVDEEGSSTASVSSDEHGEDGGETLEKGSVDEVDLEVEAFDQATERFIDALTAISRTGNIVIAA